MEPYEYQTLFSYESSYWWYRGLRYILVECLFRLGADRSWRILDAGCGTGQTLAELRAIVSPRSFGFDLSPLASGFWPQRSIRTACVASVNDIPFRNALFDAAVCVDVLNSQEVRRTDAIAELVRVLRPGGWLILVVPAYQWLLSQHDHAVHSVKRFTRARLISMLSNAPVEVSRISYLFPTFFVPLVIFRFWKRAFAGRRNMAAKSDLGRLPAWLNQGLFAVVEIERRAFKGMNFPFGSSLIAIGQKQPKQGTVVSAKP